MTELNVGVVGLGRFGQFHCEKISKLPGVKLRGVYDTNFRTTVETAKKYDCLPFTDFDSLLHSVHAVSVVTPTVTHFEYIRKALLRNRHVFVEKPLTASYLEGEEVVQLAIDKNLLLQVGHIERFNGELVKMDRDVAAPVHASALRTCADNGRCKDVCVVFDMMIHDIDILLHYLGDWVEVCAKGCADKVVAAVEFENGKDAVMVADRNHQMDVRRTIFQFDSEPPVTVNYHNKTNDALMDEWKDFRDSLINGRSPKVTGADGLRAIQLAEEIVRGVLHG